MLERDFKLIQRLGSRLGLAKKSYKTILFFSLKGISFQVCKMDPCFIDKQYYEWLSMERVTIMEGQITIAVAFVNIDGKFLIKMVGFVCHFLHILCYFNGMSCHFNRIFLF